MKQVTVISGKGGTGKTSLVAAFASLAENAVFADCDVDAPDLHLILAPTVREEFGFTGLPTAVIDRNRCTACGACEDACRFGAIRDATVDPLSCEGCGVCELVCPADAISFAESAAGRVYVSDTRFGPLCHARLYPGQEASGKLVTLVRERARRIACERDAPLILVDGSPGIGCPVIASLGGVDLALVVTEPTVAGVHDLARILGVAAHFEVPAAVVVNKCDLDVDACARIEGYCREKGFPVLARIPYDPDVTRAMVAGQAITEYGASPRAEEIRALWEEVEARLE